MDEAHGTNDHDDALVETFGPIPERADRAPAVPEIAPFRSPWVAPPAEPAIVPREVSEREGSLVLGIVAGFLLGFFALIFGRFAGAKPLTRTGMWVGFALRVAFTAVRALTQRA